MEILSGKEIDSGGGDIGISGLCQLATPALTRKQCLELEVLPEEDEEEATSENKSNEDEKTPEEHSMEKIISEEEKTSEEIDIDAYLDHEEFDTMDETLETTTETLEVINEIDEHSETYSMESLEKEEKVDNAKDSNNDALESESNMMVTPALPRKQLLQAETTPVAKTPEWSKSLSRELEEVIAKQNLLTSRTRRRVLNSLQQNYNTDEDAQMDKLRTRAIKEIVNSEKSYLKHLEIIEEYFMNPIRDGNVLPQHVYVRIFGDILGIRQVNKEVLSELEESTDHIGKVFEELAPYLKFYSTYANDFEDSIKLIEEWRAKDKDFRTLLDNQESRPEVQMRLNSLLITPVQRIPRYKLLLDDIIKNTPRFHPDRTNLETARTEIDSVAWHINDQIKEQEDMKRMVDIERSIQGGVPKIIKPGRKLVREGNLMKVNKNGNHAQARYVVLFSDMVMYCKYKGSFNEDVVELPKQGALEVCCLLPLKHMSVEEVVGRGVFTIRCQKEELVLYSSNAEDSDWVDSINKAIKLGRKNAKSLKRESSKFEPMRKKEMLKMRRESLGTIMRARRKEAEKGKKVKKELKIGSPLTLFTPRKRKKPDEKHTEEELELELELEQLITEEDENIKSEANPDLISPSLKPRSPKTPKMCSSQQEKKSPILNGSSNDLESPDKSSVTNLPEISELSPIVPSFNSRSLTLRSKKAVLKPINLARTMSLRIKKKVPPKTVFRSPSMKNQFSFHDAPILEEDENLPRTSTMKPVKSMKPLNLEKKLIDDATEPDSCDSTPTNGVLSEVSTGHSHSKGETKHQHSQNKSEFRLENSQNKSEFRHEKEKSYCSIS